MCIVYPTNIGIVQVQDVETDQLNECGDCPVAEAAGTRASTLHARHGVDTRLQREESIHTLGR